MRRFEFIEGGSSKFWQIEKVGSTLNINFGRIGTKLSIHDFDLIAGRGRVLAASTKQLATQSGLFRWNDVGTSTRTIGSRFIPFGR